MTASNNSTYVIRDIGTRVALGVDWLNRERPGWRDSITEAQINALRVNDAGRCPCGITGGFGVVSQRFQERYADLDEITPHHHIIALINHGFACGCEELDAEWRRVIRLGQAAPVEEAALAHA